MHFHLCFQNYVAIWLYILNKLPLPILSVAIPSFHIPSCSLSPHALTSLQVTSLPSSHKRSEVIISPFLHSCFLTLLTRSPRKQCPGYSSICTWNLSPPESLSMDWPNIPVHLISLSSGSSMIAYKYTWVSPIKLKQNTFMASHTSLDICFKTSFPFITNYFTKQLPP